MVPPAEQRRLRDRKIRALHAGGYSMNQICTALKCSKTTVFFAINGRRPKKPTASRK